MSGPRVARPLLALAMTVPLWGFLVPVADPPADPTLDRTAVLDRFEGDRAVLVVDGGDSLVVDATRLPTAGRHVDAAFAVGLAHGALTGVEYDPRETRRRGRAARERFDRLARAQSSSDSDSDTAPAPDSDSDRVPSTSTGSPTESADPTADSGTCVFTMSRK